jgi:hypothetical protein
MAAGLQILLVALLQGRLPALRTRACVRSLAALGGRRMRDLRDRGGHGFSAHPAAGVRDAPRAVVGRQLAVLSFMHAARTSTRRTRQRAARAETLHALLPEIFQHFCPRGSGPAGVGNHPGSWRAVGARGHGIPQTGAYARLLRCQRCRCILMDVILLPPPLPPGRQRGWGAPRLLGGARADLPNTCAEHDSIHAKDLRGLTCCCSWRRPGGGPSTVCVVPGAARLHPLLDELACRRRVACPHPTRAPHFGGATFDRRGRGGGGCEGAGKKSSGRAPPAALLPER